jgi:hypothetical protein
MATKGARQRLTNDQLSGSLAFEHQLPRLRLADLGSETLIDVRDHDLDPPGR